MRIAFDLNDVLRDYSSNFVKVYNKAFYEEFDEDNLVISSPNMNEVLPFDNKAAYTAFLYEDYPFEIYGKCPATEKGLSGYLSQWVRDMEHTDIDEDIELLVVSPMETGLAIPSSCFFLSKLGYPFREVYFPKDSATIWDRCDILVTASPRMLDNKPDNKKVVKITTDYNKECSSDWTYDSVLAFLTDTENFSETLVSNDGE